MKLLPLIKIIPQEKTETFTSSGVQPKPPECKFCPNNNSVGFVPDWIPPDPKMLLVFASPEREDPIDFHPWAGNLGYWKEAKLLKPLGLTRHDVAISHILRCYSGRDKFGKLAYPAKSIRVKAENLCRKYDACTWKSGKRVPKGIISFNPDTFITSFDIGDLRNGSAFLHLFRKDMAKALEISKRGGRPAVLFGPIPNSLFAGYTCAVGSGGIKSWRGHIFPGSWKDLNVSEVDYKENDEFAEYDRKRRTPKKPLTPGTSVFKPIKKPEFNYAKRTKK